MNANHVVERPRRRNIGFIVLFGGAAVITVMAVIAYVLLILYFDSGFVVGDAVAVVDIHGEIYYDRWKVDEIESHRNNPRVKAVLVHVNSPGGGVAASQAIYHALLKCRAAKPVVVSMASVAASGGYYVSCAADSIVAEEGTLTGSIGVIAAFLRTEELYRKIGLDVTVIKSGKFKDVGSPHRKMTEEEEAYLGDLLDTVYGQFLRAVSEGRGMPLERVAELAEGRLYSGEKAHEVGLIDRIGSYDDALEMAARMGGISGDPRIVKKRRKRSIAEAILGQVGWGFGPDRRERISLKYIIP